MEKRLFIAVSLPNSIKKLLSEIQTSCQEGTDPKMVKWVDKKDFHQTMVFLGNVTSEKTSEVKQILKSFTGRKAVDLRLGKMGFFPDRFRPRVVLINLAGDIEELTSYYHQLRMGLQRAGLVFDTRFSPHIAIGRIRLNRKILSFSKKKIVEIQSVLGEREASFKADNFTLFESKLTPKGPIHTPLLKIKLSAK
ncbi:MAG: RNA 2',3'-cyclic phosphodiesterase [Patescibacteria group bacterium]